MSRAILLCDKYKLIETKSSFAKKKKKKESFNTNYFHRLINPSDFLVTKS